MLAFAVADALAVGGAVALEVAPELELELAPAPVPAPLAEFAAAAFELAFTPAPVLGLTRVMLLTLALTAAAPELVISTTFAEADAAEEDAAGGNGVTEASEANAEASDDAPPRLPSPWLARIDFGRGRL